MADEDNPTIVLRRIRPGTKAEVGDGCRLIIYVKERTLNRNISYISQFRLNLLCIMLGKTNIFVSLILFRVVLQSGYSFGEGLSVIKSIENINEIVHKWYCAIL